MAGFELDKNALKKIADEAVKKVMKEAQPHFDRLHREHKGKPIVGMVTLWNLKANKDGTWGGGSGYKPSEDREFKAKSVTLIEGGKKLEVKGCVSIICRTATWVRAN